MAFRTDATHSRFLNLAKRHAQYSLTSEDIDAFQQAFVEEVTETSPRGRVSGDAWSAALQLGLGVLRQYAIATSLNSSGQPT